MPYQAFIEALRSVLPLVAAIRLDDIWLAVLATLLPELSARNADIPALPHIDPENERARLFGALARAFVALAQPRPLLLALEDLHWAEETTIAALAFLARRVALSPILIVATYRDNETVGRHPLRRARIDATAEGAARSLLLRPLSLEDVERLAHQVAAISPGTASSLHHASEGIPLLLSQLLEEPADLRTDRPTRVADVIESRLERLSPEARSVAEIAALVGQRFSREVVQEVGGWDGSTFGDALDELLDRRIVREATGRGALDYAFAHQAICDVVASSAPPERSPDRHRRIARTLERLHPERASEFAAELARHYEVAGESDQAATNFLTAARHALALAAVDEAGAYVDRGLSLATTPELRKQLLVEGASVSQRAGNYRALGAAANELAELANATHDEEGQRTAALLMVRFAAGVEDKDAHRKALDHLRALTAGAAGAKWRATYFHEEARAAYGHADIDGIESAAKAALAAAHECGDDASAARALTWLADVETNRAHFVAAQALLEQVQAQAARARDGAVEIDSLRASFILAYNMADVGRCVAIAERWLERGVALGDRHGEASGRLRKAIALICLRRDVARVRDELSRALSIYEELGSQRGIAGVLLNGGLLENEVGNFAEATTMTERALELFVALDDARGRATALSNLATLHIAMGEGERACREAKESIEVARAGGLRLYEALGLENLATATASLGKTADAIRLGDEALARYEEFDFSKWSGRLMGDIALWHAQLGDLAAAQTRVEKMLAQGVHVWAEWPQRFHWAAAQVLHACGDDARSRSELVRARELVADLERELTGDDLVRYQSVSWNKAIVAAHDSDHWTTFPASKRQ
jgi:tetratricopeptide (TPR) repeat protein